jgi:hypothetical protein
MFSLFLQSKKHAPTSVLFAALQRRLRTSKAVAKCCDLAPSRSVTLELIAIHQIARSD